MVEAASFAERLARVETDVGHIRQTVDRVPTALENLARFSQQIADGMASNRDLSTKVVGLDERLTTLEKNSAVCQNTVRVWNKVALVLLGVAGTATIALVGWIFERSGIFEKLLK